MVAMRYEWTPASEPPDTDRPVEVWFGFGRQDRQPFGFGQFIDGEWGTFPQSAGCVTHWRDVEPPDVEAPK